MADHALLATVGLEYCVEATGIICRPCGLVVATSKLHEHLRDRHTLKLALRCTAVEHAYNLNVEHDVSRLPYLLAYKTPGGGSLSRHFVSTQDPP